MIISILIASVSVLVFVMVTVSVLVISGSSGWILRLVHSRVLVEGIALLIYYITFYYKSMVLRLHVDKSSLYSLVRPRVLVFSTSDTFLVILIGILSSVIYSWISG